MMGQKMGHALFPGRGSSAHTLWSHKYTQAQFWATFPTQGHPRTQAGVTRAHRPLSRVTCTHRQGWGGVKFLHIERKITSVNSLSRLKSDFQVSDVHNPTVELLHLQVSPVATLTKSMGRKGWHHGTFEGLSMAILDESSSHLVSWRVRLISCASFWNRSSASSKSSPCLEPGKVMLPAAQRCSQKPRGKPMTGTSQDLDLKTYDTGLWRLQRHLKKPRVMSWRIRF